MVGGAPYFLLAALFALRLVHLKADPPYFLDWSGGLYFDEGAYTHNARNKLLFGEWRLDAWNNMYYSPLHNLLVYAAFSLFGVGFVQERLVPVALSGLALLLFHRTLQEAFGRRTALVGAVLFGANYLFIMFGRLGLFEIPQVFAGVLTLFAFGRAAAGRRPAWAALAGASTFLFYVFKNLGAYFVAAAVLSTLYVALTDPAAGRWRRLGAFVAGLAACAGVWAATFYLPQREAIGAIGSLWLAQSLPATPAQLATNVLTQPVFVALARSPFVVVSGVLGAALVGWLAPRRPPRLHALDVLAAAWLAGGVFFLALLSYRPVRYYVPLIPPLCYLATRVAMAAVARPPLEARLRRDPGLYLAVAGAALVIGFWGVSPLLRWELGWGGRLAVSAGLAGAGVVAAALVLRPWQPDARRFPVVVAGVVAALLALSVGFDLSQYLAWERRPVDGMVKISRELGRLPGPAVVAGLASPALVLENRHRAIYAGREGWFDATPDLFERHPDISHLVLATYNGELHWYYRTFPEVMARARLLKIYHVWKTHLFLYSLRPGEAPRALYPAGDPTGDDAVIQSVRAPFAVEPGQPFEVTIAVRNTGARAWRGAERVGLATPENRDPFTAPRHLLGAAAVVAPNEVATFPLSMRAPARPDLYVSSWRMVRDGVGWFGEPYLGVIWVRGKT